MTLDELKYIIQEAYGNSGRYIGIDRLPEQLEEVEEGDWIDDGKYFYSSSIYKCDQGNHFCINQDRSGSYYTEYCYGTPDVTQVKPVVETITRVVWKTI